jgi:cullin 3
MKRSELECMLTEDKYDNILQMYHFFSRVPTGQSEMIRFIRKYILATGSKMNQEANYELKMRSSSQATAVSWVQQILKLQDKTDKILAQAVNNDKSFQIAFSEAFEIFINENWKSAEFISLFIDEILKKGLKGVRKMIFLYA